VLTVAAGVLEDTFEALRRCGAGVHECVVYWLGLIDQPGSIDEVVQPTHRAGPTWYRIDDAWITPFFISLRTTRRTIRGQVHTHPAKGVRHSPVDDAFPIAPGEGFVSIVLPSFARGPVGLDGAYSAIQGSDGTWREHDPSEIVTQ
jgi:hypothetical protein